MTKISATEPAHWHERDGRHRMTDPRVFPSYPARYWSRDEVAYVEHLVAHEADMKNPQPQKGDSQKIKNLFALLRAREREASTIMDLIVTLRQDIDEEES